MKGLTRDSSGRLDIRVFHQSPPPTDDLQDDTYLFWPLTDAVTTQDFTTSEWTGGRISAFVWANRCNFGGFNTRPNNLPSPLEFNGTQECRATFSTIDLANAATQCQIRHILGMDPVAVKQPWIDSGGSADDFITDAEYRADPASICPDDFLGSDDVTYSVMTDKVLLPAPQFPNAFRPDLCYGILLDYECQDDRTTEITQAIIEAIADDIHAMDKKLILYTNPFTAPTQTHTNINSDNLPALFAAVDLLGIFLWSGNADGSIPESYANQLDMLGTLIDEDYQKLAIIFELGDADTGNTIGDATWVYKKMHEDGPCPKTLIIWRNFAVTGADLTNKKIWYVCFGQP